MSLTPQDYLQQRQALLPRGAAWPREPDAVLTRLLLGLAAEDARVDGAAEELLQEADPQQTTALLSDWERALRLAASGDEAQRRAAVLGKLVEVGGQSRPYFIALAAALGYTITIREIAGELARAGTARAGAYVQGEPGLWWWVVTWASAVWDDEAVLREAFERLKPAHTQLAFQWVGGGIGSWIIEDDFTVR